MKLDSTTIVTQVRHYGEINWRNELIYVPEILAHEPLGLEQIEEHKW